MAEKDGRTLLDIAKSQGPLSIPSPLLEEGENSPRPCVFLHGIYSFQTDAVYIEVYIKIQQRRRHQRLGLGG